MTRIRGQQLFCFPVLDAADYQTTNHVTTTGTPVRCPDS